jgi:hypothetical protein
VNVAAGAQDVAAAVQKLIDAAMGDSLQSAWGTSLPDAASQTRVSV